MVVSLIERVISSYGLEILALIFMSLLFFFISYDLKKNNPNPSILAKAYIRTYFLNGVFFLAYIVPGYFILTYAKLVYLFVFLTLAIDAVFFVFVEKTLSRNLGRTTKQNT